VSLGGSPGDLQQVECLMLLLAGDPDPTAGDRAGPWGHTASTPATGAISRDTNPGEERHRGGHAPAVLVLVNCPKQMMFYSSVCKVCFLLATVMVCSCRPSRCRGALGEGNSMLGRKMRSPPRCRFRGMMEAAMAGD